MISSSRLTQKFQTTIPKKIRKLLQLKSGDIIGFQIIEGNVILKKATALDVAFAKATEETLSEWASEEDEEAYGDL
jgi:antitoxin PrlF